MKIGLLSVALLNIGRVDYIAALIITVSNVFASALPLVFSCYCLTEIFDLKGKKIIAASVNAAMMAGVLLTKDFFTVVFEFLQNYYVILICFTTVVIPLTAYFFKRGRIKTSSLFF